MNSSATVKKEAALALVNVAASSCGAYMFFDAHRDLVDRVLFNLQAETSLFANSGDFIKDMAIWGVIGIGNGYFAYRSIQEAKTLYEAENSELQTSAAPNDFEP